MTFNKCAGPARKGFSVKRSIVFVALTAVLFLMVSGTVFAATPQDIWNDFNDNGVLDGTYTTDELRAYLNDATLHQYPPNPTKIKSLDALVRGLLSARNRFPFTGTEIALVAIGAVVLLGAGLGLRRIARARS
jgi:hypothetical protein